MRKRARTIRDFVLLPFLILICLVLIIFWAFVIDSILGGNYLTGEMSVDAFGIILVTVPFILLIKFIWSKVECINVDQFIEQSYEEELKNIFDRKITLFTGQTGSGKSHTLNNIIKGVEKSYSPGEMKILCIDIKRSGLTPKKSKSYLYDEVICDATESLDKLKKAFVDFSSQENKSKLIILIDEVSDIMNSHGDAFESILAEISNTQNISLVMTTSRPSNQVLTSKLLSLVGKRIDLPSR